MNQQIIKTQSLEYSLVSLSWREVLVIVSPTSMKKMNDSCKDILNSKKDHVIFTSDINYDGILEVLQDKHPITIIGIGGGTAIDYAKYIARQLQSNCIAIPSMLSTNVFATNKVAVTTNGFKHTESGVLPNEIWLDWGYLSQSYQENLYGLVDVFSIYNALRDWKYAQEHQSLVIDTNIWIRAMKLLFRAIDVANHVDPVDGKELFEVVKEAGYITNDYGSGRPESGSEHIFASVLESNIKIPHALSVTLGLYVMEYLNYYEHIDSMIPFSILPFKQLRLIDQINQMKIPYKVVQQVLSQLKPRQDKFTLVDIVQNKLHHPVIQNGLENFLSIQGFKFEGSNTSSFVSDINKN